MRIINCHKLVIVEHFLELTNESLKRIYLIIKKLLNAQKMLIDSFTDFVLKF